MASKRLNRPLTLSEKIVVRAALSEVIEHPQTLLWDSTDIWTTLTRQRLNVACLISNFDRMCVDASKPLWHA
jgi:hypothetical protein